MERKLIKQGLGGYTIYLPKKWIDKKGLKAGDQINITETDNSLIIGSRSRTKSEITIEITNETEKDLRNILTHTYRKGFDLIRFRGINPKQMEIVKDLTGKLLLGFEKTLKGKEECIIENISEPTEEKYDALLRRILLIIKETQNIIIEDFKNNELKHLNEIDNLKDQQDKFILFCRRVLIKEKYEKSPIIGWELLTFLMHIEHALYYLYKYAHSNHFKSDEETLGLLNELKSYFDMYYEAYYKKDIKIVHRMNNLIHKYHFGKCLRIMEKSKGNKTVVISFIREIFRLIQIGASPILINIFEN